MKITRRIVQVAWLIAGLLVLASYVIGAVRMDDPSDLWGGIPESWIIPNVICMFIAVIGYIILSWFFLVRWDPKAVEAVQWPCCQHRQGGQLDQNEDVQPIGTGGHARLLLAFMLFLIPSMFWLELTILHIWIGKAWTQVLVIVNLWLVCIGNILLFLLAISAHRLHIGSKTILPIIGALMLGIQVIINDGIIWNVKFPW